MDWFRSLWKKLNYSRVDSTVALSEEMLVSRRPRGIYEDESSSIITQPSNIPIVSDGVNPYMRLESRLAMSRVQAETLIALKNGCTFEHLVERYPNDVVVVLKDLAVAKLDTFEFKDELISRAFGSKKMLTKGAKDIESGSYRDFWDDLLQSKATRHPSNKLTGWEENIDLAAYTILLKEVACPESNILDLLLQKFSTGPSSQEIWELTSVQAIINYHWQHWAQRTLSIIFIGYLLWMLCFGIYAGLYIESSCEWRYRCGEGNTTCIPITQCLLSNLTTLETTATNNSRIPDNNPRTQSALTFYSYPTSTLPIPYESCPCENRIHGAFTNDERMATATQIVVLLCFIFMCPFAIEEYITIITQGVAWIEPRNMLDLCLTTLQGFFFACHIADYGLEESWFGLLIGIQIVFLSMRLLRFTKLLGGGTTFVDTAWGVIYDVRYWLLSIIFAGIAISFSLGAFYKSDRAFVLQYRHTEFYNVFNSLVTTFQIVFGSFDASYVFHAYYKYITSLFFFAFQVFMTITILNLIIAAMADSYTSVSARKVSQVYKSRAALIQELMTLRLPKFLAPISSPYVHFIVPEKKIRQVSEPPVSNIEFSNTTTNLESLTTIRSLEQADTELSKKLDKLSSQVEFMLNKLDQLAQNVTSQLPMRDGQNADEIQTS